MKQYRLDPLALERLGRLRAETEAAQLRAALAEQSFTTALSAVCRELGVSGRASLRYAEGVIVSEEAADDDR